MANWFKEYRGLRKEFYLLLLGRIVSSMGALVFSMLALILKNKLGFSPSGVADVLMYASWVYIPGTLIAGQLADRYNKKNLIMIFSLLNATCETICAFIPLSIVTIGFHISGSLFALMQWPCYDALFADLSKTADRDRVYSLNYLGNNLGGIITPIIGGLLFKDHLALSFLITAISALLSTCLLFFFVKDISKEKEDWSLPSYQQENPSLRSLSDVFRANKLLFFYLFCLIIVDVVYSQFMFLLPLNLEQSFGEQGATYYGFLMSLNSLTVALGTALLTGVLKHYVDIKKVIIGQFLIVGSLTAFIFTQDWLPGFFIMSFVFTLGEICSSLGQKPYLTKRVPASYRGRLISLSLISVRLFLGPFNKLIGWLMHSYSVITAWSVTGLVGVIGIISYLILTVYDARRYPFLHRSQEIIAPKDC